MRWVFVSLLLLNGLVYWYFEWRLAQSPAEFEPGVPRLVLLEELPASIVAALEVPEPAPILEQQPGCVQIGPFRERSALLLAQNQAAVNGWEMTAKTELVDWRPAWWVYLGPFSSLDEAAAELAALRQRWPEVGAHVIRRGVLIGGVSLGLYSQQDRAVQQQRYWLDRGEFASVKEIRRKLQQFWLLTDQSIAESALQRWLSQLTDGEGREPQQKSCTY